MLWTPSLYTYRLVLGLPRPHQPCLSYREHSGMFIRAFHQALPHWGFMATGARRRQCPQRHRSSRWPSFLLPEAIDTCSPSLGKRLSESCLLFHSSAKSPGTAGVLGRDTGEDQQQARALVLGPTFLPGREHRTAWGSGEHKRIIWRLPGQILA